MRRDQAKKKRVEREDEEGDECVAVGVRGGWCLLASARRRHLTLLSPLSYNNNNNNNNNNNKE